MNIKLIFTGQTDIDYIKNAIQEYVKRLHHYVNISIVIINPPKFNSKVPLSEIKFREGELILKHIVKEKEINGKGIKIILLDEKGTEFRSVEFASFIQKQMNMSLKSLIFIIGGAYGFSPQVYEMIQDRISISKMTFSHQLIRILLLEQIYRAFTIIKNEPYHNE
ncbi:MAG: 23S rRNA (pseudouridine(1915)-N(3))-methyltransferase RlmH [Bacteroidales bacterium]|jgi:23S rRNA (pseudouridine1915-N3)-methyltransferase|nr:23S rRNA (pseudouridine(1915)-N(3))-methyltransferase RlmH [Bacteroidales bacterium]